MKRISPAGFALALVILAIVWMALPNNARLPLFIVLVMGALAATHAPVHTINKFFGLLK
jgi:hypothetical protein